MILAALSAGEFYVAQNSLRSRKLGAHGRSHHRYALYLLGAAALDALMAPPSAPAQTTLPDINVIAPSPVSGGSRTKPSTAPAAPARRTGAAPSTGQPVPPFEPA